MLMDHADMYNAERRLEIAEAMSCEVATIDVQLRDNSTGKEIVNETAAATQGIPELAIAQSAIKESATELDYVAADVPQPRTARVLSITELRSKLGIEQCAPAARPAPQLEGARPRIIRRREPEYAVG